MAAAGDAGPTRRGVDTLGMREATFALPEQVAAAVAVGEALDGLPRSEEIANILVLGAGPAGAAGDLLAALGDLFLPIPVVVAQGYDAPNFVGPDTLVVALSPTGDDDEVLQSVDEAHEAGGRLLVVSGPGSLAERARSAGAPLAPVPTDLPAGRVALGALAVPVLVALERMGLFSGAHGWIGAAVDQLRRRRDELDSPASPALALARRLGRSLPIVYGAGALGGVAARRWKAQINENAKSPAFAHTLPELGHDEIAGWGQHGDVTRQVFQMVFLRHEDEHPLLARRYDALDHLLDEVVGAIHTVEAQGEGALAQVLDLVLVGDAVSLELAAQEGIDPGPAPAPADLDRAAETL